jgi:hypothetical protein
MIHGQHNMAQKFVRTTGVGSSALPPGACVELEGLAEARKTAFADYSGARDRLSFCAEPDGANHEDALAAFQDARRKLRVRQRNWEEHVAAHHIG